MRSEVMPTVYIVREGAQQAVRLVVLRTYAARVACSSLHCSSPDIEIAIPPDVLAAQRCFVWAISLVYSRHKFLIVLPYVYRIFLEKTKTRKKRIKEELLLLKSGNLKEGKNKTGTLRLPLFRKNGRRKNQESQEV